MLVVNWRITQATTKTLGIQAPSSRKKVSQFTGEEVLAKSNNVKDLTDSLGKIHAWESAAPAQTIVALQLNGYVPSVDGTPPAS